jgi:hypothetical protein
MDDNENTINPEAFEALEKLEVPQAPAPKRARRNSQEDGEPLVSCTVDKSKTSFYLRLPRSLMTNIVSTMLIFDKLALQFKKDKETGKDYIISVFQHNTSVIQTTRLDQDEIEKAGGEFVCNTAVNVGFQPLKLWQLLSKTASHISTIELCQMMTKDGNAGHFEAALTVVIGAWEHNISLLPLDSYRHQRPEQYTVEASYVFDPSALLSNLTQAKNVPTNVRSAREMQIVLDFTDEGVQLGTARNVADPNSRSTVLLAHGGSKRQRNCDTSSIKCINKFAKPVSQIFDLKLLQAIIKPSSLLTNEITVEVSNDKPMQISYSFPGGKTRLYLADQIGIE